jgi:hypothetical protein
MNATTLVPGLNRDQDVTVTFTPTVVGSFSGSLEVSSDDPDQLVVTVPLTGDGFESSGSVVLESLVSGGSTSSTTVTSGAVTVIPGHTCVATAATKPDRPVIGVTGLGGTWTQVAAQCGARSQTAVSVWISTDAVTSGTVTLTTSQAPSNAVIAVAGYSGVNQANPVGKVTSANTLGGNGACSGGGTAGLALVTQSTASPSLVTISGTFSANVDWSGIAIELQVG